MIGILDQIDVHPDNINALLSLIETQYLPGAINRGMSLRSTWISPPVALTNATNSLWVMWEVPDVGAWWNMRFQSGADPSVASYWKAVDELCVSRQRHYLGDGQPTNIAQPYDSSVTRISRSNGVRQTSQYFLRKGVSPDNVDAWTTAIRNLPQHIPGLKKIFLGRNLEGSFHAGDLTADAHFTDSDALHSAQSHSYWKEVVEPLHEQVVEQTQSLELRLISGGLREPDIGPSIKRTAYFRVLPGAERASIAAWEKDLLDMPCYMRGMTNWSLSKAAHDDHLYAWEQEYVNLGDLQGEYMVHPHHWAHVDTWFDPEFSRRIVDTDICHAFCESKDSILGWTLKSGE